MNLNTNGETDGTKDCNIFGKYFLRNGEWWLEPYVFDDADGMNCWVPDPNEASKYLCMAPANSACILDKTVVNYGGDSETDETVWQQRTLL